MGLRRFPSAVDFISYSSARRVSAGMSLEQLFMELYELRLHDSVYPPLPQFDHLS